MLRSPIIWARHLGLDPSDVFLASYPRSGNTLLRFPLGEVIAGIPTSFEKVQQIVPEIGVHVYAYPLLPSGGRLIKTHERFRRKYRRAIYIVRDVRDVMLSAFAREAAMGLLESPTLDSYIEPFLQGKMSRWGSWQDHVEEWLNSPPSRNGDLMLMHFEEIRNDVEGAVARALGFLGMTAHPAAIHQACVSNSLENMRLKEDESRTLPKSAADEGRLVSTGTVQGWTQKLSREQIELVHRYAGTTLVRLGYTADYSDAGAKSAALVNGASTLTFHA